ncbi:MAG: hypothetical protein AAF799_36020 [Myxococcota bacterium]
MPDRKNTNRREIPRIASLLGLATIDSDWSGVDPVLPLLEHMRQEGAVVVFKLDGGRGPGDNGPYTGIASGPPLGDDFVRIDADTLEDALASIIVGYATRVWGHPPSE